MRWVNLFGLGPNYWLGLRSAVSPHHFCSHNMAAPARCPKVQIQTLRPQRQMMQNIQIKMQLKKIKYQFSAQCPRKTQNAHC